MKAGVSIFQMMVTDYLSFCLLSLLAVSLLAIITPFTPIPALSSPLWQKGNSPIPLAWFAVGVGVIGTICCVVVLYRRHAALGHCLETGKRIAGEIIKVEQDRDALNVVCRCHYDGADKEIVFRIFNIFNLSRAAAFRVHDRVTLVFDLDDPDNAHIAELYG